MKSKQKGMKRRKKKMKENTLNDFFEKDRNRTRMKKRKREREKKAF